MLIIVPQAMWMISCIEDNYQLTHEMKSILIRSSVEIGSVNVELHDKVHLVSWLSALEIGSKLKS